MSLINIIRITNTSLIFFFIFCFIMSKSSKVWHFAFSCVETIVFKGLLKPYVVIVDQSLGLQSCQNEIWLALILQFCKQHAAQNVKKRLAKKKYLKKDQKKIEDLVWLYLWLAIDAELKLNQEEIKAQLQNEEVEYLTNNQFLKEKQFICLYT